MMQQLLDVLLDDLFEDVNEGVYNDKEFPENEEADADFLDALFLEVLYQFGEKATTLTLHKKVSLQLIPVILQSLWILFPLICLTFIFGMSWAFLKTSCGKLLKMLHRFWDSRPAPCETK